MAGASTLDSALSSFASDMVSNKYAHEIGGRGGRKETWEEVAYRQAYAVVRPYMPEWEEKICRFISERKMMPGGRYLYAAGRRYPQVNNCLGGDTKIITRTGILSLLELVGSEVEVLNRCGEWEKGTVHAFGQQRLFRITFSNGDVVEATANHRWWMEDCRRLTTAEIKHVPLNRMKQLPGLSEEAIRHGICFGDGTTQSHIKTDRLVLCSEGKRSLVQYFPEGGRELSAGLTVTKLPRYYKSLPDPKKCSPDYARGFIAGLIATDGSTKTSSVTIAVGVKENAEVVRELAVLAGCIVNGVSFQKGDVTNLGKRNRDLYVVRLKPHSAPIIRPDQLADLQARRLRPNHKMRLDVVSVEDTGRTEEVYCCVIPGSESFTLSNGLITSNCFLFTAEDCREGWGELCNGSVQSLMTGGGIGVVYSKVRQEGELVKGMGGYSSGPIGLMNIINESGRHLRQGGSRRSAVWAGLHWNHPDIFRFIVMKDWPEDIQKCKNGNFAFPAPMDGTNISVILDDDFFTAYYDPSHRDHHLAHNVFWTAVRHMLRHGEPGFSVDVGENAGEHLRNACTEVTSRDNGDMCNLASLNLARIETLDEMMEVEEAAIVFLMCGTLYSKLPLDSMYKIREKNRRLGLGLMGVHEWLLKRGYRYEPNSELEKWLKAYESSGAFANRFADKLSCSRPAATRSIAPTGTISIVAETTSGIEPIYAVAYKRRYFDGNGTRKARFVIDATAKRLIETRKVDPDLIEDSYTLAEDVERRIRFQGWVQGFVDHGISSTINLPAWGSSLNNENIVTQFGNKLLKHLPQVRGITAYPDGSRGGQPLTRVSYQEALQLVGKGEFVEEQETEDHSCKGGVCYS
jgi:ribonucleoside-diphosphate reductase alpha chain